MARLPVSMSESQPLCISWKSSLLSPACPDKVSVLSSCQPSLPRPAPLQYGAPLDRLAPDGSSTPPGPHKPSPAVADPRSWELVLSPLWGGTQFWDLTRCTEAGCMPHPCNPDCELNNSFFYIVRSDLTKRKCPTPAPQSRRICHRGPLASDPAK